MTNNRKLNNFASFSVGWTSDPNGYTFSQEYDYAIQVQTWLIAKLTRQHDSVKMKITLHLWTKKRCLVLIPMFIL